MSAVLRNAGGRACRNARTQGGTWERIGSERSSPWAIRREGSGRRPILYICLLPWARRDTRYSSSTLTRGQAPGLPRLICCVEQGFLPVLVTRRALQPLGLDPAPALGLALQKPQG